MKIKQTAGKAMLGEFAKEFAFVNDDILFGEVWSDSTISPKIRSMITISTLIAKGMIDSSFEHHLAFAKQNGVTKAEMAALITHVAFYAGWPNAWAAFNKAVELYKDDSNEFNPTFGLGDANTAYAKYFIGNSYLKPLTDPKCGVFMANVTFEPSCRNNWHIHNATKGGGQILLCTDGEGWYVEEGASPRELHPGDVVIIPANVKHWHGAKKDSWFSHIAVECPGENTSTKWCEPVNDDEYNQLD